MPWLDFMKINFPASGVETYLFFPPLVAFTISFFTSMAGISGAFLLLPFQMSVLGFTSPSVSSTNLLYNVIGTPGGVLRYLRERRMVWPLSLGIMAGTLPGVIIGYYLRVRYLPDPGLFKCFVGVVLLFAGIRILQNLMKPARCDAPNRRARFDIERVKFDLKSGCFDFRGSRYRFHMVAILLPSFLVGIVGGIYGIGGGAIIAPFCISVLKLPVFTIAGSVLLANFGTSFVGLGFYAAIPVHNGAPVPPDWLLGLFLGLGGLTGMYAGAKCQRFVPERILKLILACVVLTVSGKYILQVF